jgi:hypothetical protein
MQFLEITDKVQDCLTMWLLWVGGLFCNLMHGVHNVWTSSLGLVVEFAHNLAIIEVEIENRGIMMGMK